MNELTSYFRNILERFRVYIIYGLVGVGGAIANILVTWLFTEFVFGIEQYFAGYVLGLAANILFNFIFHALYTFRTRNELVVRRFTLFTLYSLILIIFHTVSVRLLVPVVGEHLYLLVIAAVITFYSIITFLVSRYYIFSDKVRGDTSLWRNVLSYLRDRSLVRHILFFCIFALILRFCLLILLLMYGGTDALIFGDTARYLSLAESMLSGEGYFYEGGFEAYRPPGYPIYLLIFKWFGLPLWMASVLQMLVASLIPALVWVLAVYNLGLKKWVGNAAALFASIEPVQLFYSVVLLPDVLYAFLFLLSLVLLIKWMKNPKILPIIYAGLVTGVSVYFRPVGLYFAIVVSLSLILYLFIHKRFLKKYLLHLFIFIMLVALCMAPWVIRNHVVFGEPSFVSASAFNLYIYGAVSTQSVVDGVEYEETRVRFLETFRKEAPFPEKPQSLYNKDYLIERSKGVIFAHPFVYAKNYLLGLNTFLFSGNYHYLLERYHIITQDKTVSYSLLFSRGGARAVIDEIRQNGIDAELVLAVGGKLFWLLLSLGSLIGAVIYWRRPLGWLYLTALIYFCATILSVAIGVEARHRYMLNPLIFIFFFAMVEWVHERYISRHSRI